MRDVDRMQLSQLAFIYCLDALDETLTAEAGSDEDDRLQLLMLTHQVRQYAVKMQIAWSQRADKLLISAYHRYIDIEVVRFVLCLFHVISCVQSKTGLNQLTATGNHMPYRITQCYLPPGSGDFPAFTLAKAGMLFSDPGGMQG